MPSHDCFRFVQPYPKHLHYRNGDLYFAVKRGGPRDFSFYAGKTDVLLKLKDWDRCSRVELARGDNAETLRRMLDEIGFTPPCPAGRRIMRSLVRAGYAVRL